MSYNHFFRSPAGKQWKRIGISRRSGVVIPLFSIYSRKSVGIGEIPDLKLVVDWCLKTGMSIIQLLPLNELGFDASPYNSTSTFALEPAYIRLQELREADMRQFDGEIKALKSKFSRKKSHVDYSIRSLKLKLLQDIYSGADLKSNRRFPEFVRKNKFWLEDYAVYKVLKERNHNSSWEEWNPAEAKYSVKQVRNSIRNHAKEVQFQYWVQWQLFEQMKDVKEYAESRNILIMGDMPFLVSRDSADVWANRKYFNLDRSAGAPPDMYFAFGQKWGMPVYNWKTISKDKYSYIRARIKYADNFYDMFRIDHFVGLFRIWTIGSNAASSEGNKTDLSPGKFEPLRESQWEKHGKKIIKELLKASVMLPCAEDLGTVPACSYKTLREYKIPGIDFQRFHKKQRKNFMFVMPENYRKNSSAVISTHDTSFFPIWWMYEAGTIDKALFEFLCKSKNIRGNSLKKIKRKLFAKEQSTRTRLFWKRDIRSVEILLKILHLSETSAKRIVSLYKESFREKEKFIKYLFGRSRNLVKSSPGLQSKCIERVSASASVFSIQLIQEYLFLNRSLFKRTNRRHYRINFPGTVNEMNWSLKLPLSMESLLSSPKGKRIINAMKRINRKTGRYNAG